MTNRISLAVVPFDSDFTPRRADNGTKIGDRCGPADLIAYPEKSGLFAVHLRFTLLDPASSTQTRRLIPADEVNGQIFVGAVIPESPHKVFESFNPFQALFREWRVVSGRVYRVILEIVVGYWTV
jgi:hypothetical protein